MNTALSRPLSVSAAGASDTELPSLLLECARFVRHSRSLASMLPALIISGAASLMISLLLHTRSIEVAGVALHGWIESSLTLWPLLFPVIYLAGMLLRKLARMNAANPPVRQGLSFRDISAVAEQVNASHQFPVLRGLKRSNDYLA